MSPIVLYACLLVGQTTPPPLAAPPDTPAVKAADGPREIPFEDLVRRAHGNDAFIDEVLTNKQVIVSGLILRVKRHEDQAYEVLMRTTVSWTESGGEAFASFHFKAAQRAALAELPTGPDQLRVRISGKCVGCNTEGGWVVSFTDCQVVPEVIPDPVPPNARRLNGGDVPPPPN